VNNDEFHSLLQKMEGETLDFKAQMYDLSSDLQKAKFIKDVLCMANTPREDPSYILLGVKKHIDGTYELLGLDRHVDEAELQGQFKGRVHPIPEFTYEVFPFLEKRFGIIKIPPDK
jgi:predicted HTH transcriptional regulator